jgi:hypothetical protein
MGQLLARTLPGSMPAAFPGFIAPCLATLRSTVPNGGAYVHELKLDGYRIQAHLQDDRVTLYTRSGLDWTNRFTTIAKMSCSASSPPNSSQSIPISRRPRSIISSPLGHASLSKTLPANSSPVTEAPPPPAGETK